MVHRARAIGPAETVAGITGSAPDNDHVRGDACRRLIGGSKLMEDLSRQIAKAAQMDAPVLIQGETGTGKELVTRAIHEASRRARHPLIAVNCANLPETLVETELFGHERGAFTGADKMRRGKFELADGGTLFLDEIGELSSSAQAKLLRVLQEHEIDRIGGERPIRVDFRVIAATHRDLERMARDGAFREDLYYRLNGCLIRTPALRDRLEDLPALARHFMLHNGQMPRPVKGLSREVLGLFLDHSWPGNVRELQQVVQRAMLAGDGEWITPEDLPSQFHARTPVMTVKMESYRKTLHEASRQLCLHALAAAKGNCRKAARSLGLDRATFYRIAKRHGLDDLLEA